MDLIKQFDLINRRDWDNLIILDSCRFDYFDAMYRDYLFGRLLKVDTEAGCTTEWIEKWLGNWEVHYFSSMPLIHRRSSYAKPFQYVHHIWKTGWDDVLGTIGPRKMNREVVKTGRRVGNIIHYMQPHQPYIGDPPMFIKNVKLTSGAFTKSATNLQVQLDNMSHEDMRERLDKVYRGNLRVVLEAVRELIPHLDGKIIITADHGDHLGDGEFLWHWYGGRSKILNHVPWLEVERDD